MFPHPPSTDIDKSRWAEGPWQTEPDAVAWIDGKTNLNCAMIRHPFAGAWRGFVAVDPLHPLHGKDRRRKIIIPPELMGRTRQMGRDFSVVDLMDNLESIVTRQIAQIGLILPAHGSLTYSTEDREGFWWFGFDCMHGYDIMPAVFEIEPEFWKEQIYRDHDYVHGIVTRLASAIQELGDLIKATGCII